MEKAVYYHISVCMRSIVVIGSSLDLVLQQRITPLASACIQRAFACAPQACPQFLIFQLKLNVYIIHVAKFYIKLTRRTNTHLRAMKFALK